VGIVPTNAPPWQQIRKTYDSNGFRIFTCSSNTWFHNRICGRYGGISSWLSQIPCCNDVEPSLSLTAETKLMEKYITVHLNPFGPDLKQLIHKAIARIGPNNNIFTSTDTVEIVDQRDIM